MRFDTVNAPISEMPQRAMRLPEYCATHTLKEFMEMVQDPLTDRDCVYMDGKCDCTPLDDCKYLKQLEKEYDVLDKDHPDTCRCEVCRFWS